MGSRKALSLIGGTFQSYTSRPTIPTYMLYYPTNTQFLGITLLNILQSVP